MCVTTTTTGEPPLTTTAGEPPLTIIRIVLKCADITLLKGLEKVKILSGKLT